MAAVKALLSSLAEAEEQPIGRLVELSNELAAKARSLGHQKAAKAILAGNFAVAATELRNWLATGRT